MANAALMQKEEKGCAKPLAAVPRKPYEIGVTFMKE